MTYGNIRSTNHVITNYLNGFASLAVNLPITSYRIYFAMCHSCGYQLHSATFGIRPSPLGRIQLKRDGKRRRMSEEVKGENAEWSG